MIKYNYRLRKIHVRNFMSVGDGMVTYPKTRETAPEEDEEEYGECSSEILGLYGMNGTGKTAMIASLHLLLKVLDAHNVTSTRVPDSVDWSRMIRKGAEASSFSYSFQIFHEDPSLALGTLTISFSMKENEGDILIFDEKIECSGSSISSLTLKTGKELSSYTIRKVLMPLFEDELKSDKEIPRIIKILREDTPGNILFLNRFVKECHGLFSPDIEIYPIMKDFLFFLEYGTLILSDSSYSELRHGYNSLITIFSDGNDLYGTSIFNGNLVDSNELSAIEEEKRNGVLSGHFEYLSRLLNTFIPDISVRYNPDSHSVFFLRNGQKIRYDQESYGTRKLLSLISSLRSMMLSPFFLLVVDELDEGIFEYLLGNILSAIREYGRGQLLFTAHNLISAERLSKRSIWFTTTDPDKRFLHISNLKMENNLRDIYFKEITGKRNSTGNRLRYDIDSNAIASSLLS